MFYYLSAAALQYLVPTLLLLFSVLMLRTLGELKVEENRLHMSNIEKQRRAFLFRPFHPNIRSDILHIGLSSNPVVLENLFDYYEVHSWIGDHFLFSHDLYI